MIADFSALVAIVETLLIKTACALLIFVIFVCAAFFIVTRLICTPLATEPEALIVGKNESPISSRTRNHKSSNIFDGSI